MELGSVWVGKLSDELTPPPLERHQESAVHLLPQTNRNCPAVAYPATLPSNTMAVVRTMLETKKPRIAVLNEGPCVLAAGAG